MSALVLLEDMTLEFGLAASWERDATGHLTIFDADDEILAEFAPGGWEGILGGPSDDECDGDCSDCQCGDPIDVEAVLAAYGTKENDGSAPGFSEASGAAHPVINLRAPGPDDVPSGEFYPEGHPLAGQPKYINAG